MRHLPVGNYIIMVLATVTFAIQFIYDYKQQYLNGLILDRWTLSAVLGYMWLHGNLFHIICNLILLWIFGRQVCLRVGNTNYPFAYIFVGVASAITHMLYDGRPAIGASGAIMGILGMHLIICYKQYSPAGPWIILVWFLLNLSAGITGYFPTAYMAHAGGFFAGMVLANVLLLLDVVENSEADLALLQILQ